MTTTPRKPRATRSAGKTAGHGATSPEALATREKQLRALEMRIEGHTFQTIADHLGYEQPAGAYKAVQAILKARESESADELRAIMDEQLDLGMLVVMRTLGSAPDADLQMKAVDRMIKLQVRRARLHGLDAPTKIEGDGKLTQILVDPRMFPKSFNPAGLADGEPS